MVSSVSAEKTTKHNWIETPPQAPRMRRWTSTLVSRFPWLDSLANPLQQLLHKMYGRPGQSSYKVKDALNGVWLGHPVHPALVTVPIGAWTGMMILDLDWLAQQNKGVARSADILMATGLIGAVGSAVTGATNWVDTDGPERRTGLLHALLNSSALALNVASLVLRLTGRRKSAITLSTGALALVTYSGFIGGELAYSNAVGVNHVASEGGSDNFVPVINVSQIKPGKLTRVDVDGIAAVLVKEGDTIRAIAATCSHLGGPLDQGHYEDGVVYCPWHRSGFHMCDGSVANSPAVYAQPTFDVRIRDGKVELRRREHA